MREKVLRWAGALVATLLAVGALIGSDMAAYAESNGGVRLMPLGDSITDGVTVPGGYRIGLWQRFVNDGYKVDFVGSLSNGPATLGDHDHEGHSGWRIDQIDANIAGWLRSYTPHTVLLHIGTNDVIQNHGGHQGRDLGLQWRSEPAVAGRLQRHHHRRPVRPVPGRDRRLHRQRRVGPAVALQRRRQPEVELALVKSHTERTDRER